MHPPSGFFRHSPEHVYAVVSDVRSYPEYLPWIRKAKILSSDEGRGRMVADLDIGFGSISVCVLFRCGSAPSYLDCRKNTRRMYN